MGQLDRLTELEDRVADAEPGEAAPYEVVWADAAPEDRPTGMAWDPDAKRLTFDFWGAQSDALDALAGDVDLVALLGGYRSGKSVAGARWLLTQALDHPGTRHLAMGIDFAKSTGSTYRVLFEQLPPVDVRTDLVTSSVTGPERSPLVDDYHRGDHRLTLSNGSVIKLGAADVWNRYAGDEYSSAWLDEPSHYADLHAILEMVGSRLTAKAGPKKQFWTLTGNGYNAAWRILEEREDEDGSPIGLDIELVTASVRQNPYLTPEDIERLERQFEGTGREVQAIEGGFSAGTGLVYSAFDRDTHVIEHDEARDLATGDHVEFKYAYDAGWRDPRVVLAAAVLGDGRIVVHDEFYKKNTHVEDAIRWMDGLPQGVVYSEHEPSDIRKFDARGWYAVKANKSLDAGIAEVRRRLRPDPDTEQVGLLISERCTNLIREFEGYKEEHVGTSKATDHAVDACRYLCMGEAGDGGQPTWSTSDVGLEGVL